MSLMARVELGDRALQTESKSRKPNNVVITMEAESRRGWTSRWFMWTLSSGGQDKTGSWIARTGLAALDYGITSLSIGPARVSFVTQTASSETVTS